MEEVDKEYLKKLLKISKEHFKKYGYQKMDLNELDKLCS